MACQALQKRRPAWRLTMKVRHPLRQVPVGSRFAREPLCTVLSANRFTYEGQHALERGGDLLGELE